MIDDLNGARMRKSGLPKISHRAAALRMLISKIRPSANLFAMVGGVGFLALVAISIISIVRRKLGLGSVNGDIELMQIGTAVFAAAFMPLCTVANEHLRVEFFTENASRAVRSLLDDLADGVLAAIFLTLAWRTLAYALSLRDAGDVTTLLSIPVWIPVILIVPSLALAGLCAVVNMIAGRRESHLEDIVR